MPECLLKNLSDAAFKQLTILIGRAIRLILTNSKLSPSVVGQQFIPTSVDKPSLPLRGEPTVKAMSDHLANLLSTSGLDSILGGTVGFREAVVRFIIPRYCSICHEKADKLLTGNGSRSLAIGLVSPAQTLAASYSSQPGKLLRAVYQTIFCSTRTYSQSFTHPFTSWIYYSYNVLCTLKLFTLSFVSDLP